MPVLPSVMKTQIVTEDRNVVTKDVDSNVLILSVCGYSLFIFNFRVDSRLRECDNNAFFAILAQNFKFPA